MLLMEQLEAMLATAKTNRLEMKALGVTRPFRVFCCFLKADIASGRRVVCLQLLTSAEGEITLRLRDRRVAALFGR